MTDSIKNKMTLEGVVKSNNMTGSIVLETKRLVSHTLYGKMVSRHKKFMADDPGNICDIGDTVLVEECRPISKNKRWRVLLIVKKAV